MQAVAIILGVWIYTVSISGFMQILNKPPFNIGYPILELSLISSIIGVGLGFFVYGLSLLKSTIKIYIIIGSVLFILLLIFITYLGFGTSVFFDLTVFLLKIGFSLLLCFTPLIGVYSLLKKQKNSFLVSGASVFFFYFFALILSKSVDFFKVPFYSTDQIVQLLLFFISTILYLELGTTSIYFDSVIDKLIMTEDNDEFMLVRFNQVFNKYILIVPVVFIIFYFISLFFFWVSSSFSVKEFMGLNLTTDTGIFLLVILTIVGAILFWLLIPAEKPKKD